MKTDDLLDTGHSVILRHKWEAKTNIVRTKKHRHGIPEASSMRSTDLTNTHSRYARCRTACQKLKKKANMDAAHVESWVNI